jgi:phenylalanyl-tRNA synthetase beta chain
MAIAMSDIEIKPSPVWLQAYLQRVGIRPINNVVDLTNFFMLETGQPSHAYDYDKLKALDGGDVATIVVRNPRENEKITLLNGKTIDPRQEAIMIASDSKLIGVGGVMGGAETEVDDNTKNIVLEVANFDMYSVRRTSMAHGLFTDAVTRFNKGQSPLQNAAVLAKLVEEMRRWANGKVASELIDINQVEGRIWVHPPVPVTTEFINTRLGFDLSADDMKKLLENVEFKVDVDGDKLTVTAPFWRTDVETREDVVEEVGRLYGFDHLPLILPTRSVKPVQKDELLELKTTIRHTLAQAGANEVLTYSFVHGDLVQKAGQNTDNAFRVGNALSPDLQYYRVSLMPSLLEKVHPNQKAGYGEFALFELGKAHLVDQIDEAGLPREDELVALVVSAADKLKKTGAAFYAAKHYLTDLVSAPLSYRPVPKDMQAFDITKPYDLQRASLVYAGDTFVGIIGEFRPAVTRALKLPKYCAGFELDIVALKSLVGSASYVPLSKFPAVWQDLTLKVKADQPFDQLHELVDKALAANAFDDTTTQLDNIGVYQATDEATHKNVTFRIHITGFNRTLTDKEVNKVVDAIAAQAQQKLGAERI